MLERENLVPMDNPVQQLQLLAAEVVKWKELLGDKVEELSGWTRENASEQEDLRAIIAAYERALDRTNAVLSGIIRLNIEERLVKLSEAQAELLKQVVVAVLDSRELGLTSELRRTGRTILARELSAVTSARPVIRVSEHAHS